MLMEHGRSNLFVKRLTGEDCFIPLGNAWQHVLPSRNGIVSAVRNLIDEHAKQETNLKRYMEKVTKKKSEFN